MRPAVPVSALQPGENWKLISNGIPSDMSSTYRTIPKFRAYEIVSRLYLRRRIHQNVIRRMWVTVDECILMRKKNEKKKKKIIETRYIADI